MMKLPIKSSIGTAVFLLLCSVSMTFGQSEYYNVRIHGDKGWSGPCEPSIAVSNADPNVVVAGAVLNYIYRSEDGGFTWKKQDMRSRYGVWGDPCLVSNSQGDFHYLHLSDPTGKNWSSEEILDRIVCQTSTDEGKSWGNDSYMGYAHPKDQDKEWAAVDLRNDDLFATWTEFDKYNSKDFPNDRSRILFSRYNGEGESKWTEPIILSEKEGNCLDSDSTTEGAVPAVGPDGQIYVAWSFDNEIHFDRSFDRGKTWLENDLKVADQPGGWDIDIAGVGRCNGMPVTGCDVSTGPFQGRIYVNWADQRNGEKDTDVFIAYSDDQGNSWSDPIRVNDDKKGAQQFLTWMSVDPITGSIYIVFYDRRNYNDTQTDVYLASSKDGGITWVNERISESPFDATGGVFFGDYNNISSVDGVVRPIWTRQEGKETSIWTAIINK